VEVELVMRTVVLAQVVQVQVVEQVVLLERELMELIILVEVAAVVKDLVEMVAQEVKVSLSFVT
jgi:hypothetical protein